MCASDWDQPGHGDVAWGMRSGVLALALILLHLTATAQINAQPNAQTNAPAGGQGFELRFLEFEGTRFEVVTLDLRRVRLEMRWKDGMGQPWKTFRRLEADLSKRGERLLAVMNAGIFDTSFRPLGLHVEGGRVLHALNTRQRGYGNFYMQPNGVFVITPDGARLVPTSTYQHRPPRALEATQSGPMLVVNGRLNAAFQEGSANRLVRNGIGVQSGNRVHLVMAVDPVNFFDFARFIRDGLKCPDGLYLDGHISSLSAPGTAVNGGGEFAGMLTVIAR